MLKKIDEILEESIECCYNSLVDRDNLDSCVLSLLLDEYNITQDYYNKLVDKYYKGGNK